MSYVLTHKETMLFLYIYTQGGHVSEQDIHSKGQSTIDSSGTGFQHPTCFNI